MSQSTPGGRRLPLAWLGALGVVLATLTVGASPVGAQALSSIDDVQSETSDEFYVDPMAGSETGDGSAGDPWKTLEQVVQDGHFGSVIGAGDTVWLRTGYHGEFVLDGGSFATPVTVAAAPDETPRLRRVALSNTRGWVVRGLSISPSHAPTFERLNAVQIGGSSADVTVEDNEIFTVDDASDWSASDWDQLSVNGINAGGTDITLRNNVVRNVNFAISVPASNSLVEGNLVDGFAGDGMRGLGDFTTFQNNVVKNSYNVNDNHDDGFQSWSVGDGGVGTGEVRGIVLRGNTIINYEDPNRPLIGPLQAIGNFDGMYVDWIVENNLVITDHWHGITFLGARDVRVVNNTVIDIDRASSGRTPWIQIGDHKDGTPSTGTIVRNNLTSDLVLPGSGVTADHNLVFGASDKDSLFVDAWAPNFDAHLLPGADAVDGGSCDAAPLTDIEGTPRPQGASADIGAYEWTLNPHPNRRPGKCGNR